jgi:3',5'-cyclic-AMP phosphodiesterase
MNQSRRNLLRAGVVGAMALGAEVLATPTPSLKGGLRVAHLTDIHVQPERGGGRGMAACLRHVRELARPVDLILNTGDSIYDSYRRTEERTKLLWDLWHKMLKDECALPLVNCIGNHDIWGWDKKRSKTTGEEGRWGKKWAMEALGLERPYYSLDRGGWHLVVLDSVVPFDEKTYRARLDDEQFAWLERDLAATDPKRPVMVASHIPIMSPAAILNSSAESATTRGELAGKGGSMHLDVARISRLFAKHPNVKVCVSGHLHLIDRAEYRGVTYLCNPAVSGSWWKGRHLETFGEMYTVLDLMPDGTFGVEYVSYGWVAEAAPEKEKVE